MKTKNIKWYLIPMILIVILYLFYSFIRFKEIKKINELLVKMSYESYVQYYLELPKSGSEIKDFLIEMQVDKGVERNEVLDYPILKFPLEINYYEDSLRKIMGIIPLAKHEKSEELVSLSEITFLQYLFRTKSVILFRDNAYTCGALRRLILFNNNEHVLNDELENFIYNDILLDQFTTKENRIDLIKGYTDKCYYIKAVYDSGDINFEIKCRPTDKNWVDDKAIDSITSNLLKDKFNYPFIYNHVSYFYFPLIIKKTDN
ncbi:MAG TPA: hypothetical protein VIN10_00390 [Bacteroidales bacterium]